VPVHCQLSPGARTGFVFICPGRFEAARGYPCAAGTGANLERALPRLHEFTPELFPSPSRAGYVITNSWDRVEYQALTGRSVPTEAEVLAPANLERLQAEIAPLRVVVACGSHAHAAVRALLGQGALAARVAYARHLSQRSVNTIRGAPDTAARLRLWCAGVLEQLRGTRYG
jgi:hypothetical protein